MWSVNNPISGECEYLGEYCMGGNYKDGCKKSYMQESKQNPSDETQQMESPNYNYGSQRVLSRSQGFKASLTQTLNQQFIRLITNSYQSGSVLNCYYGSGNSCQICKKGYIQNKDPIDGSETCVIKCPEGTFPNITVGDDQEKLFQSSQQCSPCHQSCENCLLGEAQSCTSCHAGYYLNIIDADLQAGECLTKNDLQQVKINLFVLGGDRNASYANGNYPDFLSALKGAYEKARNSSNLEISIFLEPSVNHYITLEDLINNEFSLQLIRSSQFKLNILPLGCEIDEKVPCQYQVKVFNKIGASFRIFVPENGLFIRNIIFDSLDSVLDWTITGAHRECAMSANQSCCTVDIFTRLVECKSILEGSILASLLNKHQACYTRPHNGLFVILSINFSTLTEQPHLYVKVNDFRIYIVCFWQDSIFQNFLYEMSSLVLTSEEIPLGTNILIEDSQFIRINMCGAIFSNNMQYNHSASVPFSSQAQKQPYVDYLRFLDYSRSSNQNRFFKEQTPASNYNIKLRLHNNRIEQLNYLKNPLNSDGNRTSVTLDAVPHSQQQHVGLIIDVFQSSESNNQFHIEFINNTVTDIKVAYSSKLSNGQEIDICSGIDVSSSNTQLAAFDGVSFKYYQLYHLFSFKQLQQTSIVIANNTFTNLSLSSSVISMEGNLNSRDQYLFFSNNSFSYIHAYINTIILDFRRAFSTLKNDGQPRSIEMNFTDAELITYLEYGGGLLIEKNNFSEIVGCSQVGTAVLQISVIDRSGLYEGWQLGKKGWLYDEVPSTGKSILANNAAHIMERLQNLLDNQNSQSMIEYSNGQIVMNKLVTNITGNSYSDVSMGAPYYIDSNLKRGSLHKFQNVMAVDFSNENYTNILPHTSEHLSQVFQKIHNVQDANSYPLPFTLDNMAGGPWQNLPFWEQGHSNSLIFGKEMARLRILESNVFDNIALIDFKDPGKNDANDQNICTKGLILYLIDFKGKLQIGGEGTKMESHSSNTNTQFLNVVGFINEHTVQKFPNWNYTNWKNGINWLSESQNFVQNSVLFNLQNKDNVFLELRFQNLKFSNMDFIDRDKNKISAILGLFNGEKSYDKIDTLIIKDVEITDATYLNGSHLFFLNARNYIIIDGLKVQNIGRFSAFKGKEQWGFQVNDTSTPNLFARGLIYTQLHNIFDSQPIQSLIRNQIVMNNSEFTNITLDHLYSYVLDCDLVNIGKSKEEDSLQQVKIINSRFMNFKNRTKNSPNKYYDTLYFPDSFALSVPNAVNLIFINCSFEKLYGSQSGIISKTHGKTIFKNCKFKEIIAKQIEFLLQNMHGAQSSFPIIFEECFFTQNTVSLNLIRSDLKNLSRNDSEQQQYFKLNSLFLLTNAAVFIKKCNFANINNASEGAVFYMQANSQVHVSDSIFQNISALSGGFAVTRVNCIINITNSIFQYFSGKQASIFLAYGNSSIFIKKSTFRNNIGLKEPIFSIQTFSQILIEDSLISNNQAYQENSIGLITYSDKQSTFKNVVFEKNIAQNDTFAQGKNGITIQLCSKLVLFENCIFIDNKASEITANLNFNKAAQVVINNCQFWNTETKRKQFSQFQGSFIHSQTSSNLLIQGTTMNNGAAYQGGAIYANTYSMLQIIDSKFKGNRAIDSGGAIYGEATNNIIIENTEFEGNFAESLEGSAIILMNSIANTAIQKSRFTDSQSINFIKIMNFRYFNISESSFIIKQYIQRITDIPKDELKNKTDSFSKYSGIDITNVQNINITQSIFKNLTSQNNGGAVSIQSTITIMAQETHINITGVRFEGCQSQNGGGALFLKDVSGVKVNDSIFSYNSASKSGGGIEFQCKNYGNDFDRCSLEIDTTSFEGNSAGIEGGAIKWNIYDPKIHWNRVILKNNTAGVYGNEIASFAFKLVRLHSYNETLAEKVVVSKRRMLESQNLEPVDRIQSGGETDLYFVLVDHYNTIVKTDSESKLYLSVLKQNDSAIAFESATIVQCYSGAYQVKNMILVGQPNSTNLIKLKTDGIVSNIPNRNNTDAQNSTHDVQQDFTLQIQLRECIEGEERLSSGKCKICPVDTYLLTKATTSMECKACPNSDQAVCLGGNQLYPQPGYWRSSNLSEVFYKCRNSEACLGQNPPVNNPQGDCTEGYMGPLCSICEVGYSRAESNHICQKCPTQGQSVVRLVGFIGLGILVLVLLVYTSLINTHANSKKNFLPVFIRIMMNHLQLLMLTAQFELEWPSTLKKFFSIFGSFSQVTTQFLTVDCLLDYRSIEQQEGTIDQEGSNTSDTFDWLKQRMYFIKLVIVAILPIIVIIASYIIWVLIFTFDKINFRAVISKIKMLHQCKRRKEVYSIQPNDELNETTKGLKLNQTISDKRQLALSQTNIIESGNGSLPKKLIESIKPINFDTNSNTLKLKDPTQNLNSLQKKDKSSNESGQIKEELSSEENKKKIGDSLNSRFVQTIVIILFLIHPSIASMMLNSFHCEDIDGTLRLFSDMEIICFSNAHKTILYFVVIPAIIIWGVGIPTIGVIIIFKIRHQIQLQFVKAKFGFLYNGYKLPSGQYWEMLIMYRKIILIFIQVFLIQQGKIVQALATLVFIIICLILNIMVHPFTNQHLNMLESLSLVCSGISVYCGLYFISDASIQTELGYNMSSQSKDFLFSLIVICHYFFATHWFYHFLQEIKVTVRKKAPKIYLAVFLCFRKQKFSHEEEVDKYMEQAASFLEELDSIILYLRENIRDFDQQKRSREEEQFMKDLLMKYSSLIKTIQNDKQYASKKRKGRLSLESEGGLVTNDVDTAVRDMIFQRKLIMGKIDKKMKRQPKAKVQPSQKHLGRKKLKVIDLLQNNYKETETSKQQTEDRERLKEHQQQTHKLENIEELNEDEAEEEKIERRSSQVVESELKHVFYEEVKEFNDLQATMVDPLSSTIKPDQQPQYRVKPKKAMLVKAKFETDFTVVTESNHNIQQEDHLLSEEVPIKHSYIFNEIIVQRKQQNKHALEKRKRLNRRTLSERTSSTLIARKRQQKNEGLKENGIIEMVYYDHLIEDEQSEKSNNNEDNI